MIGVIIEFVICSVAGSDSFVEVCKQPKVKLTPIMPDPNAPFAI